MVLMAQYSPVTVSSLLADVNSKTVERLMLHRQDTQTSSANFQGWSENDAERENHMAVTDSQTLKRLRGEEGLAEQQGRQALNIAAILKYHPQYDAARQKADTLLAKASALREQIVKIETLWPAQYEMTWHGLGVQPFVDWAATSTRSRL
jgi:hypothetical protein